MHMATQWHPYKGSTHTTHAAQIYDKRNQYESEQCLTWLCGLFAHAYVRTCEDVRLHGSGNSDGNARAKKLPVSPRLPDTLNVRRYCAAWLDRFTFKQGNLPNNHVRMCRQSHEAMAVPWHLTEALWHCHKAIKVVQW